MPHGSSRVRITGWAAADCWRSGGAISNAASRPVSKRSLSRRIVPRGISGQGALAESFGLRQGIKYRGAIKEALEAVLRIDPAFQQGSADRALGRWYHKVPGLFGGSESKAEAHLRKSLTYNPNSHASRFFLAETLFELDRDAEAIEELKKVIAAPIDPAWAPEDREFKKKAQDLLAERSR
jgi:tetratricopeptide (TPR) repeat protein